MYDLSIDRRAITVKKQEKPGKVTDLEALFLTFVWGPPLDRLKSFSAVHVCTIAAYTVSYFYQIS